MRGKIRGCYDRYLGRVLPRERALGLLFCLLLNCLVYWGAMAINQGKPLHDATTWLDRMLPVDSRWVAVYVGAYAFWGVNYVLMAQGDNWYEIFTAQVLAKLACGMIFLLIPTTNTRPNLGKGFFDLCLGVIYTMDQPTNLFPSIHCLESYICWRGIQNRWDISPIYRDFSGIFAVLVFLSTLMTKQHVVADVFGGILLGELMLFLSRRYHWGKRLKRWMLWLNRLLFGKT